MREQILECISKGGVSFAELINEVPGFEGDFQIRTENNWIIWIGISKEAAAIINELIKEGRIEQTPCHIMVYLHDGKYLTLPLVKSPRAYKKPHWLPVTYSLVKK